jgi:hypothetical protein
MKKIKKKPNKGREVAHMVTPIKGVAHQAIHFIGLAHATTPNKGVIVPHLHLDSLKGWLCDCL